MSWQQKQLCLIIPTKDFICLKSIFEKAVEWAEIAETNSIEYIEKEIDTWNYQNMMYCCNFELIYKLLLLMK